ncbi:MULTISPECIES: AAA domain-containing protein [unclassified Streptomyces]|uniref:caspase, EACC1-associated type n=1 Tax=unclassified Streptomyces TaxID=2593676 RepID=UPI0037F9CAE0
MSRNHALLIGTAVYQDPAYAALPSVRADVHYLSQVLELPAVGRYEPCVRVEDSTKSAVKQTMEAFLRDREPDELVVVYLSGHGSYDPEDGQLYYIAADSRADQLQQTAIEASYLTRLLESCAARRKILLLDCCFSGRAVQGFRSKGAVQQRSVPAVEASGVYVITASQQWEAAYVTTADEPSLFTKAMVDGLHSSQADLDGGGRISADDLFKYVSRELRRAPDGRAQTPTKSSLQVTGDIFLAKAPTGKQVPALKPLPHTSAAGGGPAGTAPHAVRLPPVKAADAPYDDSAFTGADWSRLFTYYTACLHEENATGELFPVMGSDPPRVVWQRAEEVLLAGVEGGVPAPDAVVDLADRASKDGAELWYGYPLAVVFEGKQQMCAPLVMQQIEVTQNEQGRSFAVPSGPVLPHPGLILSRLGKDEGMELLAAYQPNWRPGFRDDMVRDVRSLLGQLGLADTEHIDPAALGDGSSLSATHEGARNVAMVFALRGDSPATGQLVKDYKTLQESIDLIPDTSLGALAEPPPVADPDAEQAVRIVAPLALNEGQAAVIRAAMTRKLTVATGPPGTGKSQLIVNAIATARAAGQTVLVASTNNTAVDGVWKSCEELAPGLLVRTGNRSYVEQEMSSLQRLAHAARPSRSSAVLGGELRNAVQDQATVRRLLAEVAQRERELSELGRHRHAYAERHHCEVRSIVAALGETAELIRWLGRGRRAARARVLRSWRRKRALRGIGHIPVDIRGDEDFVALVDFVQQEVAWRRRSAEADATESDAHLLSGLRAVDEAAEAAATSLLAALVPERAVQARDAIFDRMEAERTRSPRAWATLDRLLPHVSGWAVTTRSARRFRDRAGLFDLVIIDEASQCSTPDVLPLLFRARRALVIGDPMQLTHITTLQPKQEAAAHGAVGLRASWLDEHRLGYSRFSSFHAASRAAGGTMLLDEHYRCHPDIAEISNQHCYSGRLTVLTDPSKLLRLDGVEALQWLDVTGRAVRGRNGSWINHEEAQRVHIAVERLLKRLPEEATVGVVTPFRPQMELIAGRWEHEPRVRVGTVHTFQGGQQDVMILSLVAGPQMSPRSVSWLCREVNLWNVAITRARAHLIVLGDAPFWSTKPGLPRVLLDAATKGGPGPMGTVESAPDRELAGDRFQRMLAEAVPDVLLDRDGVADGYRYDFDVRRHDVRVPVLLDHGADEGSDSARHLRLQLLRAQLLRDGVRVPVWHVWAEQVRRVVDRLSAP